MAEFNVRKATDPDAVYATLLLAFASDPVERWLYPGPDEYLKAFPDFLRAFGGTAFSSGTVWESDGCSAVAMWLPPAAQADGERIVETVKGTVVSARQADCMLALEQMDAAHPTFPHWYLPWLGVDPAFQGQGLGGRLLSHCLEMVDADHLPAYLETPNPRTVRLYERHGFEVVGATTAGGCPPVTFMLRQAR